MKTLKEFTPEIAAKIPEYISQYTQGVFDGGRHKNFNKEDAEALINWNYEKSGFKKPVIIVAENPYEAQIFFNYIVSNKEAFLPTIYINYCLLNGIEIPKELKLPAELDSQLYSQLDSQLDSQLKTYNPDYLFTANVYSNVYAAWFKFMKDEFKLDSEIGVMLDSWNDLYQKSGVYSSIFSELVCVVSKYPVKVNRNETLQLHSTNGPAVEWGSQTELTKFDGYYINGRNMPAWIFEKHKSGELTKELFINEENEDVRGGIYEVIEAAGEGSMLTFLGAQEIDRHTFVHANGELEEMILYKTTEKFAEEEDLNGNNPAALAWIKMSCPSTGQNYLIPSDSSFKNCIEAAKFHRPNEVPAELEYQWHSRN